MQRLQSRASFCLGFGGCVCDSLIAKKTLAWSGIWSILNMLLKWWSWTMLETLWGLLHRKMSNNFPSWDRISCWKFKSQSSFSITCSSDEVEASGYRSDVYPQQCMNWQLHIHIAWTSERSSVVRSQQPTMCNDCCAAHCEDSKLW